MWRATLFFACGALVGGCLRGMNQGSVTAAGRESAAGLQPTRRRLPVAAGRQLAGRAGGAQRAADGRDSQPRCHRRARRRGRQRRRGRVGGRQRPPAPAAPGAHLPPAHPAPLNIGRRTSSTGHFGSAGASPSGFSASGPARFSSAAGKVCALLHSPRATSLRELVVTALIQLLQCKEGQVVDMVCKA